MAILPTTVVRYKIATRSMGYPWMELYCALVAGFSLMCCGMVQSNTSGTIYSMQSDNTWNIPLTHNDIAWIAAAPPLASLVGTLISGPIMEKWGRKNTITILSIPFFIGWLIVGTSLNFTMIFVGRLFGGIALGMARTTAPIYVSETARAKHRGKLGYLPPIMSAFGILVGCLLSLSLNWRKLTFIMTSFPTLLFFSSLILPETPHWLIRKNQEDKAYQSLRCLLRRKGNFNDDFCIYRKIAEIRESIEDNSPFPEKNRSLSQLLNNKSNNLRSRVTLIFLLMIFQQFSGLSAIIYYLKMILNHGCTGGSPRPPLNHHEDIRPIIVGVVHVLALFLTFPLVDKVGRKCLLKISGVLMALSHLTFAFYLSFLSSSSPPTSAINMDTISNSNEPIDIISLRNINNNDSVPVAGIFASNYSLSLFDSLHSWLPLVSVSAYIASFSLASPIPYILMSEMFGTKVRSYLCSAAMLICNLSSFLVVLMFPAMMYTLSPTFTFVFYAACSLQTTVIGYIIPETKGKSLAEIENLFRGFPKDFYGKVKEPVVIPPYSAQFHCVPTFSPLPLSPQVFAPTTYTTGMTVQKY